PTTRTAQKCNRPAAVDAPALRSYIGGMCHLICRKSMTRMAFLLAVALPMWAGDAIAEDYSIGTIEIAAPWTRATPKGANIAAAYMMLRNKGTAPDRLVSGFVAVGARFEVARMITEQGAAKTRPVELGIEPAAGAR